MKKEQVVGTRLPDAAVRDLEGYGGEGGIQIVACTALHDLVRKRKTKHLRELRSRPCLSMVSEG